MNDRQESNPRGDWLRFLSNTEASDSTISNPRPFDLPLVRNAQGESPIKKWADAIETKESQLMTESEETFKLLDEAGDRLKIYLGEDQAETTLSLDDHIDRFINAELFNPESERRCADLAYTVTKRDTNGKPIEVEGKVQILSVDNDGNVTERYSDSALRFEISGDEQTEQQEREISLRQDELDFLRKQIEDRVIGGLRKLGVTDRKPTGYSADQVREYLDQVTIKYAFPFEQEKEFTWQEFLEQFDQKFSKDLVRLTVALEQDNPGKKFDPNTTSARFGVSSLNSSKHEANLSVFPRLYRFDQDTGNIATTTLVGPLNEITEVPEPVTDVDNDGIKIRVILPEIHIQPEPEVDMEQESAISVIEKRRPKKEFEQIVEVNPVDEDDIHEQRNIQLYGPFGRRGQNEQYRHDYQVTSPDRSTEPESVVAEIDEQEDLATKEPTQEKEIIPDFIEWQGTLEELGLPTFTPKQLKDSTAAVVVHVKGESDLRTCYSIQEFQQLFPDLFANGKKNKQPSIELTGIVVTQTGRKNIESIKVGNDSHDTDIIVLSTTHGEVASAERMIALEMQSEYIKDEDIIEIALHFQIQAKIRILLNEQLQDPKTTDYDEIVRAFVDVRKYLEKGFKLKGVKFVYEMLDIAPFVFDENSDEDIKKLDLLYDFCLDKTKEQLILIAKDKINLRLNAALTQTFEVFDEDIEELKVVFEQSAKLFSRKERNAQRMAELVLQKFKEFLQQRAGITFPIEVSDIEKMKQVLNLLTRNLNDSPEKNYDNYFEKLFTTQDTLLIDSIKNTLRMFGLSDTEIRQQLEDYKARLVIQLINHKSLSEASAQNALRNPNSRLVREAIRTLKADELKQQQELALMYPVVQDVQNSFQTLLASIFSDTDFQQKFSSDVDQAAIGAIGIHAMQVLVRALEKEVLQLSRSVTVDIQSYLPEILGEVNSSAADEARELTEFSSQSEPDDDEVGELTPEQLRRLQEMVDRENAASRSTSTTTSHERPSESLPAENSERLATLKELLDKLSYSQTAREKIFSKIKSYAASVDSTFDTVVTQIVDLYNEFSRDAKLNHQKDDLLQSILRRRIDNNHHEILIRKDLKKLQEEFPEADFFDHI